MDEKKWCVCIHCGEIFTDAEWPEGEFCPGDGCDGGPMDRVVEDWLENAEQASAFYKGG